MNKPVAVPPEEGRPGAEARWAVCAAALLTVLVLAVFLQTVRFSFVDYDDNRVVTEHPVILQGLAGDTLLWAFTNFHFAIWMPLTSLSHLLDVTLFGLWAGGHHLSGMLWHLAGVLAFFLAARRLLGGVWPAFFAAALYAVHPLRADSVAHVASRKDLVCAVFTALTLWAHARHGLSPSPRRYLTVAVFFLLALAGKPSAAPLPLALLFLDYHPLGRFGTGERGRHARRAILLLAEKIPLLAMSAVVVVVGIRGQAVFGALADTSGTPLLSRLLQMPVPVVHYLHSLLWPAGLSPHYPPTAVEWGMWGTAACWAGMAAITLAALWWRRAGWPLAAWGFFLVMLSPVLGLTPFGNAPVADRFVLLPSMGAALLAGWGAERFRARLPLRWGAGVAAACAALVLCLAGMGWRQTGYWRDTGTVAARILAVCPEDDLGHTLTGNLLFNSGDLPGAVAHYRKAVEIRPCHAPWRYNLGAALLETGPPGEAAAQLAEAVRLDPGDHGARMNLGLALMALGRLEEAAAELRRVVSAEPENANARVNLGVCLMRMGDTAGAERELADALRLEPGNAAARANLELVRSGG